MQNELLQLVIGQSTLANSGFRIPVSAFRIPVSELEKGRVGLEPTRGCLTGTCSATELPTREL